MSTCCFLSIEFAMVDIGALSIDALQKIYFAPTTGWGLQPNPSLAQISLCLGISLGISPGNPQHTAKPTSMQQRQASPSLYASQTCHTIQLTPILLRVWFSAIKITTNWFDGLGAASLTIMPSLLRLWSGIVKSTASC